MGSTSSNLAASVKSARTRLSPATRKETIAAVTQVTVSRLAAAIQSSTANNSDPKEDTVRSETALVVAGGDAHVTSRILDRAQTCANRGGAPLVKDELVHLVALLQSLHGSGSGLQVATYTTLASKTMEELFCIIRLLMYNPELCMKRDAKLSQQEAGKGCKS
jgi:hypothetical protein